MISLPVFPKVLFQKSYGYHAITVHTRLLAAQAENICTVE
jgi:hypothetical protein